MSEILSTPIILSGYLGGNPFGGHYCQKLERLWEAEFDSEAIAVNSATSGLLAACMACGISYGDEVIVSPWTMSATAAAPSILGAKIVFADIEPFAFTLDPKEVAKNITPRTRAMIVTNLFGQPGYLHQLRALCDGAGVVMIEDNSQAILAKENGEYAGTIGHMGVFSLNVHKHIQTGEGGVVVTKSQHYADRLRAAMNHGEMRGRECGLNLRMTEITAMMAIEELNRVHDAVAETRQLAKELKDIINNNSHADIWYYPQREDCEHSYYALPIGAKSQKSKDILYDLGIHSYVNPLTELPAFATVYSSIPVTYEIYKEVSIIELVRNPRMNEIKKALEKI